MKRKKVVYLCDVVELTYPVVSLTEGLTKDSICLGVFKHCAEIEEPKKRRMTNQELAWWLREEKHREWAYEGLVARSYFDYYTSEADEPVSDHILIRENGGEWKEPLV